MTQPVTSARRIDYAGSVHDEREIEAVVEVLRGGPQALRIGKRVRAASGWRGAAACAEMVFDKEKLLEVYDVTIGRKPM